MKLTLLLLLSATLAHAGDWLTFAYDHQRSGWARAEKVLNRGNVANLALLWKSKLDNQPKELTALTAPIVATGITTEKSMRTLVYVVGSSDTVFALDADTGETVWTQKMPVYGAPTGRSHWLCPAGVNATPAVDKKDNTLYVIASDGKLHRLELGTGKRKARPFQFVPPFSKNWSLNLKDGVLYTAISQECGGAWSGIYALDMREPVQPVVRFLFTAQGGGAGVWGRAGVAIGSNGLVYVAAGDGPLNPASHQFGSSVVAARPGELKLADWYTPANWDELNKLDLDLGSASPVLFPFEGRELLAVGAKEGVIYLCDANSLGGPEHNTALYTSPRYSNDGQSFEGHGIWGSFSTWQDEAGTRWLYVPTWGPPSKDAPKFPVTHGPAHSGSVMAYKVVTDPQTKKPALQPAWMSRDLGVPEPVAIANGVVFALSNGENVRQTEQGGRIDWGNLKVFGTAVRLTNTQRTILYALDAATGQQLYASGEAMQTFTHFSAPTVADGKVFVVDHSSTLYAFGVKQ